MRLMGKKTLIKHVSIMYWEPSNYERRTGKLFREKKK